MASKRDEQGRVEGVNDNGIKVNGRWLNYSKFFKGERNPAKGASVTMVVGEFNGKDYLNELTVIGTALPGAPSTPSTGGYASGGFGGRSSETDKRIARQVALKAAVDFVPQAGTISDVIAHAREFERYLNEPFVDANVEDAA